MTYYEEYHEEYFPEDYYEEYFPEADNSSKREENPSKNSEKTVSNVIVRAFTANNFGVKAIDFKDCLNVSRSEYAGVHQKGGSDGQFPSLIRMAITNKNGDKGDKAQSAHANLDPAMVYEWMEICKKNMGTLVLDERFTKRIEMVDIYLNGMNDVLLKILSHQFLHEKEAFLESKALQGECGKFLKELKKEVHALKVEEPYLVSTDYSWKSEKVNIYKKSGDRAPVTIVQVRRQTFYKEKKSGYPWYISISEGNAKVKETKTGGIQFDGNSFTADTAVSINLSDSEMFRCMHRCIRFIELWEMAYAIPSIKENRNR